MTTTFEPPPTPPQAAPPTAQYPMQPHRGDVVLVLGVLGIWMSTCLVFGIIAWIMGNHDLAQMAAGRMDPSGRSLTNAGRILGIVGVCFAILVAVVVILWFVIAGFAAIAPWLRD